MSRRFSILTLLVMSLGIYVATAAQPALLDDADASHALVSREMLQRGDWVVMYQDGIRYLEKAPLHYWMVAVSYQLFGQGAFQTRLPLVLSVAGLVLMVYFFARRFFGETAAFYSGLIICTSVGPWLFTRVMVPEAIFALELTALFYLFLRGWQGSLDTRVAYWGASVVMALAALTLGLIGVLFPLGVVFFFILFTRSWGRWRELRILSSTLIFLVIAVPWHWMAERRSPGFLWSYFINEHFKRALGTRYPPDYEAVPLLLWWALHLVWFFPWSFFIGYALREFPRPKTWGPKMEHVQEARLLLFIWAGLILFFFSLTSGSRMEYYSFGAWPAIAVLLGIGLNDAEEVRDRWLPRLQAGLAVIGVLASVCLGYLVLSSLDVSSKGGISHLIQYHPLDTYRLSMAHIFDLTPQTFAALRGPAVFAILIFIIGFGRAWLLRRRSKNFAATLTLAFAMALFFFAANWAFKRFEPRMSSRALADAILPYLRPQDQIVQYGDFNSGSSIPFYTHRHVWIYNGRFGTNLEIGSNYPDVPPTFLDDKQFPAFWSGPVRVFIFVPEEFRKDALSRLPPDSSYLLAESAGKYIFVNQPLRPDLPLLASVLKRHPVE
ncbi:MAG: glycosyltransferase family 39 protein [Acidobacteriia bacterium]|jgi:4-amino-4-deoxy-L-arabinose transferase-like glycosyltransferase|nr:glycosyltransferase family 39 protein [Terriglobia bacterium]